MTKTNTTSVRAVGTNPGVTPGTLPAEYELSPAEWGDTECTTGTVTEVTMPLPPYNHPIWSLGTAHVGIAFAVCNAFFVLGGRM